MSVISLQQQKDCLEQAFVWCCKRRKAAPPDADIWDLWFHWASRKEALLSELRAGDYRLSPMQVVGRGKAQRVIWGARDAVVLKWVALQLQGALPVHPLCEHPKGHGGGKRSVRRMDASLQTERWPYVCRTDIQGFYGHIRRGPLLRQVRRHIRDPVLLGLVRQYLHYSVERSGEFHTPDKGICRGCALSPLLAGFCLWAMDTYFESQPGLRYVRYMDDFVIFSRTRWALRRAVRALNVFFAAGGYRQHPDKTFIGKTEKGFDWMGVQFNRSGITGVAPRARANHRERCRRLYEQVWRWGKKRTLARLSAYVTRWKIWRKSMTSAINYRRVRLSYGVNRPGHARVPGPTRPWTAPAGAQASPARQFAYVRIIIALILHLTASQVHATPTDPNLPSCPGIDFPAALYPGLRGGGAVAATALPGGLNPPGSAWGSIGTGGTWSTQCRLPEDGDPYRLWYVTGVTAFSSTGSSASRLGPGSYKVIQRGLTPSNKRWLLSQNLETENGPGSIGCTDAEGVMHFAQYPGELQPVTGYGPGQGIVLDGASVQCANNRDGTGTKLVWTTGTTTVRLSSAYNAVADGTTAETLTYNTSQWALLGGVIAMARGTSEFLPSAVLQRSSTRYSQTVLRPQPETFACSTLWNDTGLGAETVTWGVLPALREPAVGLELGPRKSIALTMTCNGPLKSTSAPGSQGQIRGGGNAVTSIPAALASDNPTISFKFLNPSMGDAVVPVNQPVGGLVSTLSGTTVTTRWDLDVVPVASALPLIPGRVRATAVIDIFSNNL